jgi:hypothetical protein
VALTIDDLKAPAGELEAFMFPVDPENPSLDFDARLTAWLAEAVSKVSSLTGNNQDEAAKAWVYYRGFKAFVLRVTTTPTKATLDSGKTEVEYTGEQIKTWRTLPNYWLEQFNGYFTSSPAGVAVGQIASPIPEGTRFN